MNAAVSRFLAGTGTLTAALASLAKGSGGTPGPQGNPGPPGANGTNGTNGLNAFTTVTAPGFVQPLVGATVSVPVTSSAWAALGQPVFVASGGEYVVSAVPDATHLLLSNTGAPGNAPPAAAVPAGSGVSPSGVTGLQGPPGAGSSSAAFSADGLGSTVTPLSVVPLGYAPTTLLTLGSAGFLASGPVTFTAMRAKHTGGGAGNAGMLITYFLYKNGVVVPGNSNVVAPADANANLPAAGAFSVSGVAGDLFQVVAQITGGPLGATVTDIAVSIS
jgi:hypothetical protein